MAGNISVVFDQPGAALVHLLPGAKFPPIENEWQKKPHTFAEAAAHAAKGGNVGILAGNGFIGLDKDQPDAFNGLELPATTTWETRPGRLGMWFKCADVTPELLATYGKKPDQAQLKLFKDGKPCGEVKLQRTYQVIPPSYKFTDPVTGDDAPPGKGDRVEYKLLDSSPPATITLAQLLADLQAIGITFSSKLETNAAKLDGIGKKARQKHAEGDEARTRRYAVAALRDEALIMAGTPPSRRNDQLNTSSFKMGQLVAAKVLTKTEVISELSKAATNTGLEPDEIQKTIISGLQAGAQHPREIPNGNGPKAEESQGPALEEIEANYKANPDSITDPAVLVALRQLSSFKIAGFFKKLGITGDQKKILQNLLNPPQIAEVRACEVIPEYIQKIARRIAEHGKPLKFMLGTFNQTHKGDRLHAESQFIGFGLQSAYNTKGVFGTWDGPSGKGKSDAAKACVRQLPEEYTIISSVTAKSLYHRAKSGVMLPATVLYLDDKNIEAGSDLEETLKRIQTFFQEGAEHETLDGKGGYVKTKLPPRLLVVRTYVDSSATDGQLKNRSMDFGVDSSKETDKEVFDLVMKLGKDGQTTDMITRRTLICRALWQDIKSHVYRVKHPASDQLIEMSDKSNRRNPSLFLDMVVGLVCINHKQCDAEDRPNGEKILYSTYADYVEAARLFNSQGEYLGTRLDKAEFEAVQYIKEQGNEGGSINGIFNHLLSKFPNDGWNTQRVRRLMDGRPDREIKGLADTVPGIEPRWKINDNGSKYKVYSIPGDLALGVRVTVHDPRTKLVSTEDLSHLSRRFPTMGKEENDSSIPPIPTSYPKPPLEEKGWDNTETAHTPNGEKSKSGKSNLIMGGFDFGKTGKRGIGNEALDVGKPLFPGGNITGKDGKTGMGPHPRKDEPTPANSDRIKAAAISEYGMAGWVDPTKLAHALKLPLPEVVVWLQANYAPFERPGGGGTGYKQRRAGEAQA